MLNVRPFTLLSCALLILAAAACVAQAQPDFGPATRETDRATSDATTRKITGKIRRPANVSITVDTSPDEATSSAEEKKFFVRVIEFTGMRRFTPQDLSYITKKYINRELSSADINKLTKSIELEYLKRGMVSVVFVPPQEIRDEILKIQVMEPDAE